MGKNNAKPSSVTQVQEVFSSSSCSQSDYNAKYRLVYSVVDVDNYFVRVLLDKVYFTFSPSYVLQSGCHVNANKEYDVNSVSCSASDIKELKNLIGTYRWLYVMDGTRISVDEYFCNRQSDDGCVADSDDTPKTDNTLVIIIWVVISVMILLIIWCACLSCSF